MKFWRRQWSLTSWLYSDGSSHHKESEDEVLKEMVVLDLLCITRWGAEWWGIPQKGGRIIPNQECLCSLLSDWAHCHQQWQKMQIYCFPTGNQCSLLSTMIQKCNSKFGISCSKTRPLVTVVVIIVSVTSLIQISRGAAAGVRVVWRVPDATTRMNGNHWIVWSMTVGLFIQQPRAVWEAADTEQLGLPVIASDNSHQVRSRNYINSLTLIRKF
jgi:hypothetical protein